jgi:hypothetical protein
MPMWINIKEAKPYDSTNNAKVLGNFCWDIEKYLEKMNESLDKTEVNVCSIPRG